MKLKFFLKKLSIALLPVALLSVVLGISLVSGDVLHCGEGHKYWFYPDEVHDMCG